MSMDQEAIRLALPEKLQPLAREITTYLRELPRLCENEGGRFVVIQGDQTFGTWPTFSEALEVAYERFGLDQPFMIQKVDQRDIENFAEYFRSKESVCP